ncbi:MAG TPA: hypothetical protein VGK27_08570 [Candidatus Deferrimicrobiaceae bacterium]
MAVHISRSIFCVTISLFLLSGCAHTPIGEPNQEHLSGTKPGPMSANNGVRTISGLDFDTTWDRTLNNLYFKGYPIKRADRNSGTIVTDKKVMLLSDSDADCPEFRASPYIQDKRAIKYVSQVIVIRCDGGTVIQVVSKIDGSPDDRPMEADQRHSCTSRGVMERELAREIISSMKPSQPH